MFSLLPITPGNALTTSWLKQLIEELCLLLPQRLVVWAERFELSRWTCTTSPNSNNNLHYTACRTLYMSFEREKHQQTEQFATFTGGERCSVSSHRLNSVANIRTCFFLFWSERNSTGNLFLLVGSSQQIQLQLSLCAFCTHACISACRFPRRTLYNCCLLWWGPWCFVHPGGTSHLRWNRCFLPVRSQQAMTVVI